MCPITDTDIFHGRQPACDPNASGKVTKNRNLETKSHEQIYEKRKRKNIYLVARKIAVDIKRRIYNVI